MWSHMYKGYYLSGKFGASECTALCSPSGFGYTWRKVCCSAHAAKCAVTKHSKGKS